MSGETEAQVSGWTVDTLHSHLSRMIDANDRRYDDRLDAAVKLIEAWREASITQHHEMDVRQQQRFEAQQNAINAAITAQRAAIDAALVATDKATHKAEMANEARFASVNEFRAQLTDQAATFVSRVEFDGMALRNTDLIQSISAQLALMIPREEALAAIARNSERIQDVAKRMESFINRDAVMAQYNLVMAKVDELTEKQTRAEGKGSGLNAGWLYLLGVVAALGTILTLYVALR